MLIIQFLLFSGVRAADAAERKQQALDSVAGWGGDILEIIQATPAEATSRSDIRDRWTLPIPAVGQQSWGRDNVTVTGEARRTILGSPFN